MSSITIYLDDALEARLRQAARHDGISVSRLVAKLIEDKTAVSWPADFLALAGSWGDMERPPQSQDAPRESL